MVLLRNPRTRVARISILVLVVCALSSAVLLAASGTGEDPTVRVVEAYEAQVGLLKWVGGAVVTGLVAAVGILYRSLERANTTMRDDLIAGAKVREEIISKMLANSAESLTAVRKVADEVAGVSNELKGLMGKCPACNPNPK